MRKAIAAALLCGVILAAHSWAVDARTAIEPPITESNGTLESEFFEFGYQTMEDALRACEEHFGKRITLPVQLPAVHFTHQLGKCDANPADGERNDHLNIEYLNERVPQNHYMIRISPVDYGIKFTVSHGTEIARLVDGTELRYYTSNRKPFNMMVFEKDRWQYVLSVDKRTRPKVGKKEQRILQSVRRKVQAVAAEGE